MATCLESGLHRPCNAPGLQPYFMNSVMMAIPAVLFSTTLGALTGYTLTKWRFKGSNIVFALILFGCFVPFQVVILPMAQTLGILRLTNTVYGLILVHSIYGLAFTTLFFRNYYVTIPDEPHPGCDHRRSGILYDLFPHPVADFSADHRCGGHLAIHPDLE